MKTILLFLLCGTAFCAHWTKPARTATVVSAEPAPVPDTVSFTQQIQPILHTHCMPCHFPGGKMYEKMPFDQPKTILDHQQGVLKRFKDEQETKLLTTFMAEAGKKE